MAPIGIAVVGLGKRALKKALGAIVGKPEQWQLVAATDPIESARELFQSQFKGVPVFSSVEELLEWNGRTAQHPIQAVYVAVPHHCYPHIVPNLLSARLHLLKEKPAAITPEELLLYQRLAESHSVILSTAGQRRYSCEMARMKEWLPLVGDIHFIEARRKLCIADLGEGWRAHSAFAGGGAMADVGWHLTDMVIGLANVGQNCVPKVAYSRLFRVRRTQDYDCEDSAEVILDFPMSFKKTTAKLTVSRIGHNEVEEIIITGERGVLTFDGNEVSVQFEHENGREHFRHNPSQAAHCQSDIEIMFAEFQQQVRAAGEGLSPALKHTHDTYRTQDLVVTKTLQAIYRHASDEDLKEHTHLAHQNSAKEEPCAQSSYLAMEWPKIDWEVEKAVSKQLHEEISIYGNEGVFEAFETEFKNYHGANSLYALLHNSGTNALHALFFAAGLMPGDEVVFPVYTFHATCSPSMHFGIKPVFCDATKNGTISARAVEDEITTRTKAVVVTHMWGIPCDMVALTSVLKQWPHILLFEDCSHAHGAKINSQHGQKIVTGGEGGITLTKHADFHYRQLIFGHYNKRCKLEIPTDHHLYPFTLTGAGPKNRAHPLAIAIALSQLQQLPGFHAWKTRYATQMTIKLASIPFLELPSMSTEGEGGIQPAWYAYVMRFKAAKAPSGLTRERFVAELQAKGLMDVDIPRSTGLLHREPLYNRPQELLPWLYADDFQIVIDDGLFQEARAFYDEAVKLPVYATKEVIGNGKIGAPHCNLQFWTLLGSKSKPTLPKPPNTA
ncbi:MAG: hypothetical protein Q9167_004184 [Letrouitia subvulpina]